RRPPSPRTEAPAAGEHAPVGAARRPGAARGPPQAARPPARASALAPRLEDPAGPGHGEDALVDSDGPLDPRDAVRALENFSVIADRQELRSAPRHVEQRGQAAGRVPPRPRDAVLARHDPAGQLAAYSDVLVAADAYRVEH